MCGIAGVMLKDPSIANGKFGHFVNRLHTEIEARGRQASGMVVVSRTGEVRIDKADKTASEFIKDREPLPADPWYILLHTRYATKGDVKDFRNNHPVIYNTCFTVHNGSVANDDDLFKEHGLERHAEVDTEIIPALIDKANFDPGTLKSMFRHVEGSVACATIDPIRHPGKVLILRTEKSPFHIIETDKIIVWASTIEAIKKAWGGVFGTPPKDRNYKYLPEWKMMVISDHGYTVEDLDKPVKQYSGSWKQLGSAWIRTGDYSYNGPKDEKKDEDTVLITALDVGRAVRQKRANGYGKATVVRAVNGSRPIMTTYCHVCGDYVDDNDMQMTLKRGRMCSDCSEMYNLMYKDEAEQKALPLPKEEPKDESLEAVLTKEPTPKESKPTDTAIGGESIHSILSTDQYNTLELWAEEEDSIHKDCLTVVSDIFNCSEELADWLMFRMVVTETTDPRIVTLIESMWNQYDDVYVEGWEHFEPGGIMAYRKWLHKGQTPLMEETKQEVVEGEVITPLFRNASATKRPEKCLFCNKKHRYTVTGEGVDLKYCTNHFERCSRKGCIAPANHTQKDGIRVCHTHARGLKECYADTTIQQRGYEMERVT